MDKYEYNVKSDQIKKLYSRREFEAASKIADEIDWYRVKDNTMLNRVADVYENVKQYEKAKEILLIAYERSPLGRQLAYKLTILALRTNNFVEADEFYQDFVEMSPADVSQYLLKYRIAKAKGEDIEVLISILEAYIDVEMDERWQYELAKLYHQAGKDDKCIDMCDELILWFNDGKYVDKAKELKKLITGMLSEYKKINSPERDKKISNVQLNLGAASVDQQLSEAEDDVTESDDAELNREFYGDVRKDEITNDYEDDYDQKGSDPVTDSQDDSLLSTDEEDEEDLRQKAYDQYGDNKVNLAYKDETTDDDELDDESNDESDDESSDERINPDSYDSESTNYDSAENDETIFNKNIENGKASSQEIMAFEAVKAAEEAAKEAQKAADFARRLVEEAKLKAQQLTKSENGGNRYSGMTAQEISKTLEEEDELSGDSDFAKKDSMIEIFEFDKNKEGKGTHIGDELTKTAEIDIDEINLKIAETDNIYNTANIQAALAKSMEKLMNEEKKAVRNVFDLDVNNNEVVMNDDSSESKVQNTEENNTENNTTENNNVVVNNTEVNDTEVNDTADVERTVTDKVSEKEETEITAEIPVQTVKALENESTVEEPIEEATEDVVTEAAKEEVATEAVKEESEEEKESEPTVEEPIEEATEDVVDEVVKEESVDEVVTEEVATEAVKEEPSADEKIADLNVQELEETKLQEAKNLQIDEIQETPIKEMKETSEMDFKQNTADLMNSINDSVQNNTRSVENTDSDDDSMDEPTKRIDSDEINRILNETKTLYNKAQKEEHIGLDEPMPIEDQIEGQMTIEEVLAEYDKRKKAEEELKEAQEKEASEQIQQDVNNTELQSEAPVNTDSPSEEIADEETTEEDVVNEDDNTEDEVDERLDLVKALAENNELDDEAEEDSEEESVADQDTNEDSEEDSKDDKENDSEKDENESDEKSSTLEVKNHKIPAEYKSLFNDFTGSSVAEEEIADCLDNLVNKFVQDGTSRTNNVIITGSAKVGKTTLGLSIIKAANRGRNRSGRKVAKVKASALNKRGVTLAMMQILGTDLIIEHAGNLMPITIVDLMTAMKNYTEEMLIVFEDDKAAIDRMIENMPDLKNFFTNRLDIKEMEIDDMAKIAKDYALEQSYEIDDMGMLALYAKLDDVSGKNSGITQEDIQEIVDDAIKHANRLRIGKLFGKLRRRSNELSVLTEEDFM